MNHAEKAAIRSQLAELCETIDVFEVLIYLRLNKTLTTSDEDRIRHELTRISQALRLIETVQIKDNGWDALLNALVHANQRYLANLLKDSLDKEVTADSSAMRSLNQGSSNPPDVEAKPIEVRTKLLTEFLRTISLKASEVGQV